VFAVCCHGCGFSSSPFVQLSDYMIVMLWLSCLQRHFLHVEHVFQLDAGVRVTGNTGPTAAPVVAAAPAAGINPKALKPAMARAGRLFPRLPGTLVRRQRNESQRSDGGARTCSRSTT
jgi:hypothetical protein